MGRIGVLIIAVIAWLQRGTAEVWVKGGGGSSCDTVCQARGGCLESAWPTSEEQFNDIAKEAGFKCETLQEGGAKYDPSTDGNHCGWMGPDEGDPEVKSRCATAGDHMSYRFCPCAADKEL